MNIIKIDKANFKYPNKKGFDNFNFIMQNGEIACLVGSNGSGKTSLLKLLGNKLPCSSVFYNDVQISKISSHEFQKNIAIVFNSKIRTTKLKDELTQYLYTCKYTNSEIEKRYELMTKYLI